MSRTPGAKDKKPRKKAEYKPGTEPWRTSPFIKDTNPNLEAGYNTRRIQFMKEIMPTEPLDRTDVDEMERRFARYLQLCEKYDMKVGNLAAYAAIGLDKREVWSMLNVRTSNSERCDFLKKVQQICAMYREGLMEDGKVNPVTGIFWQKNYDGFKDQQEVVLAPTNPLGDSPDAESMKKKYLEDSYGIVDEKLIEVTAEEPELVK